MVQTGLTVLRLSRAQTVKPRHDLLCLLPLWVVGIAALLARLRTLTTCLVVGVLAAVTLALTAVIPLAPRVGWPLPDGHGALLLTLGQRLRLPLTVWLPTFVTTRADTGYWQGAAPLALRTRARHRPGHGMRSRAAGAGVRRLGRCRMRPRWSSLSRWTRRSHARAARPPRQQGCADRVDGRRGEQQRRARAGYSTIPEL